MRIGTMPGDRAREYWARKMWGILPKNAGGQSAGDPAPAEQADRNGYCRSFRYRQGGGSYKRVEQPLTTLCLELPAMVSADLFLNHLGPMMPYL